MCGIWLCYKETMVFKNTYVNYKGLCYNISRSLSIKPASMYPMRAHSRVLIFRTEAETKGALIYVP